MPTRPDLRLTAFLLCLCAGAAGANPASRDWPSWSGPNLDLTVAGTGVLSRPGVGLEVAWSRELGSGYSGLVVADGRVITAFSDATSDYLGAFDAASGQELWRYRIADTYAGHDGSDDGPLATPAVDGDRVFFLGPWGHLFALALADGQEIWTHRIDEVFGARKPEYGFTTKPTVIDGVLVVQTGGTDGRAVSGFDPATGKHLWSTADATVDYQSPLALRIDGKLQVFAASNQSILGLEPKTGKELWKHELGEPPSEGFAQPIPLDGDKVLLTDHPGSTLYQLAATDGGYELRELWQSRGLRGTYAIPVPYEGHLYGYAGNILSCVDATSGETVWKSRPPGGGFLVLVDGHLVIQTNDGHLVVAEATPDGYVETARTQVLEKSEFHAPVFAGGRFYVRNLHQLASVRVIVAPAGAERPSAPVEEP